jgi:stage V sporulation protein G
MSLSEVEILPVKPRGGLVAFASCVLNGQVYLGNIGIHTRPDGSGYRLVFPVKVLPNGKEIHCFHPLSRQAGDLFLQAIIRKFEELTRGGEDVLAMSKQCGGSHGNSPAVS